MKIICLPRIHYINLYMFTLMRIYSKQIVFLFLQYFVIFQFRISYMVGDLTNVVLATGLNH